MTRLLTNLAAVGSLALAKPLAAIGIIKQSCGWRRTCAIGLKTVASKFSLATFGLNSGYDGGSFDAASDHLRRRMFAFLEAEPCARVEVVERGGRRVIVPGKSESSIVFRAERIEDVSKRFVPPNFVDLAFCGTELIDVVCRLTPNLRGVDVWMQFHHAAVDGAPMHELLTRIRTAWGAQEQITFPAPGNCATSQPWHKPGDREIHHATDFVDFTPLLDARRASKSSPPPPVAAMLIWRLAQQAGFEGKRFASTVDVPEAAGKPRCVDLVVTRPADFPAFEKYAQDFARQIDACRARKSPTSQAMRTMALIPPRLALATFRANSERTRETFGTVGLSILRGAQVFLAPMSDPGFEDGFLAIGGMDLPTADGRRVGSVSVKGDAGSPELLLEAVRGAASEGRQS